MVVVCHDYHGRVWRSLSRHYGGASDRRRADDLWRRLIRHFHGFYRELVYGRREKVLAARLMLYGRGAEYDSENAIHFGKISCDLSFGTDTSHLIVQVETAHPDLDLDMKSYLLC